MRSGSLSKKTLARVPGNRIKAREITKPREDHDALDNLCSASSSMAAWFQPSHRRRTDPPATRFCGDSAGHQPGERTQSVEGAVEPDSLPVSYVAQARISAPVILYPPEALASLIRERRWSIRRRRFDPNRFGTHLTADERCWPMQHERPKPCH